MSNERNGLPVEWEIVSKGWTAQELFEFLERRYGSRKALDEMNAKGRALRWQTVRLGRFRFVNWATPNELFSSRLWIANDGRVLLFPSPSPGDFINYEIRYGRRVPRIPVQPPWDYADDGRELVPEPIIFMTLENGVRQLWPPRTNSNAGDVEDHDWEEATLYLRQELWPKHGDPRNPQCRTKDWKSESDIWEAIKDHLEKFDPENDPPHTSTIRKRLKPILEELREQNNS